MTKTATLLLAALALACGGAADSLDPALDAPAPAAEVEASPAEREPVKGAAQPLTTAAEEPEAIEPRPAAEEPPAADSEPLPAADEPEPEPSEPEPVEPEPAEGEPVESDPEPEPGPRPVRCETPAACEQCEDLYSRYPELGYCAPTFDPEPEPEIRWCDLAEDCAQCEAEAAEDPSFVCQRPPQCYSADDCAACDETTDAPGGCIYYDCQEGDSCGDSSLTCGHVDGLPVNRLYCREARGRDGAQCMYDSECEEGLECRASNRGYYSCQKMRFY